MPFFHFLITKNFGLIWEIYARVTAGVYSCRGINGFGTVSVRVEIIVKGNIQRSVENPRNPIGKIRKKKSNNRKFFFDLNVSELMKIGTLHVHNFNVDLMDRRSIQNIQILLGHAVDFIHNSNILYFRIFSKDFFSWLFLH